MNSTLVSAGLGGKQQEQKGELKRECLAQGDFHRFWSIVVLLMIAADCKADQE
ncbi:MAG: hypothetical protein ACE37N_10395 [Pseudohongiellaceae bacterium]